MKEYKITVVIVGESAVGKTCLMLRFTENSISNPRVTILDAKSATLVVDDCQVKMIIKDTAGGETYRSLTPAYFRDAQGVIFAYDINKLKSFEQIPFWMNEMECHCTVDNVVSALVGTKTDVGKRQVTIIQGSEFASRHDMLFTETSAVNSEGVDELFKSLARKVIEKQYKNGSNRNGNGSDTIRLNSNLNAQQSSSQTGDRNVSANVATNVNCFC